MKQAKQTIVLAVLIPAFREAEVIGQTLESILAAGMLPKDVYLIDDGSPDATGDVARGYEVNVLRNSANKGKAGSVSGALVELRLLDRYTHVAFLDADTLVDRRYFAVVKRRLQEDLRACEDNRVRARRLDERAGKNVSRFLRWLKQQEPIGVLCGRAKSIPHNWITAFRAYEYWLTHAIHKPAQAKMKVIMVAPGCASTYSVATLKEVVWTDRTMTEDMDATIQAALAGKKIAYEHDAVVYTQDPHRFKEYVGQLWRRWYAGTWQVMGVHGLLWRGLSSLHWECRFMTLEPLAYIVALGALFLHHRGHLISSAFGLMFLMTYLLAAFAAWRERRWDIIRYAWIYPFILTMNLLLFVGAAWNIFGRRKVSRHWYSVERYQLGKTDSL